MRRIYVIIWGEMGAQSGGLRSPFLLPFAPPYIYRYLRVSTKSNLKHEVMMRNLRTRQAMTPKARRMTSKLKAMIVDLSKKNTPELLSLRLFWYVRLQNRRDNSVLNATALEGSP